MWSHRRYHPQWAPQTGASAQFAISESIDPIKPSPKSPLRRLPGRVAGRLVLKQAISVV
jgi:hypothetical protein